MKKSKKSTFFSVKKPYNEDKIEDIELIPQSSKHQKTSLEAPLLQGSKSSLTPSSHRSFWSLGHLIPLSCGHNGDLRPFEVEVFEYYLKNAKLVGFEKNI